MAKALKGTNVASGIVPFTDSDNYATHYALYGKGGFRSVNTIAERDAIPSARCEEGMICYVIDDPSKTNTYQLIGGKWERSNLGASIDSVKNKEELESRPELKKEGQMVFLLDSEEMLIYSPTSNSFVSTGNVRIQDEEPVDDSVLWIDSGEKSIPEYTNEDLQSINEAIEEIRGILQKHQFAFECVMTPGGFTNNLRNELTNRAVPEKPEAAEEPTKENEIPPIIDDPYEPEYPGLAEEDGVFPNLKHLCVKMGSFSTMTSNKSNFVDGELLWCVDTRQLYIMSKGSLVWLNKSEGGGGSGAGDLDYNALDKLDTIGFISPSGQVYRVKVNNNGELVVYRKELDTPISEPTGGTNDGTGWIYVTTLFLQKLYINSLYCGGLSSNEHSYNYCSHNFVELSNLTTSDISLNGLSLQYGTDGNTWEVLPLWGTIKAQSTFLIRGAQCSVMNVNTTRIKVKTFDMEWRDSNGELIKFDSNKAKFYLTWGTTPSSVKSPYVTVTVAGEDNVETSVIRVSKGYIDLVGLQKQNATVADTIDSSEKNPYSYLDSNKLFTKYYAMDPVSQATKALTARNNANDWYFVDLSKDLVPNVEAFTPRASFENKSIFYNKTKLEESGPNLVSITFGIQATAPNATRCFNWVSVGYYDEYLWYCSKGSNTWIKVESFKNETGIRKYYNRIRMEATDGTAFTSHKVIVKNLSAGTYQYKVGRALSNGEPDTNYMSKVLEFTVRNESEVNSFKFVQVSDQQGFNWDEYTVWKITADYIKSTVPESLFTINTGDLTQNGNRINEWLDYYSSRDSLRSLEEMTTIGNNDLCPENIYVLGNGGDSSKINSTNMSFFYTYEIDEENPPIFNIEGKEVYIESLYSFNFGNTHFICLNSEISELTEKDIYKLSRGGQVYSFIKQWCENDIAKHNKTWKVAYCHEMPFTIMTQNLIQDFYWNKTENQTIERAGSRINTNNSADNKYWFSQFCQNNGIRLVLCGHKHTQTCSWPLKENVDSTGKVISMKPIIQVTSSDLTNYFGSSELYEETEGVLKGYKYPSAWKNNANYEQHKHLCTFELVSKINAPVYFMSQATGYKHTSNKELPAPGIPWLRKYFPAKIEVIDQTTINATVNAGQRYPFYTIWEITPTRITGTVKKLNYVFDSKGKYNINLKSSDNPPAAIGGNGETNGDEQVIIEL